MSATETRAPAGCPDIDSLVAEIADRFTEEVKQGGRPSVEEYAKRHPEIATIIRQVFPALQILGDISAASNSVVRGFPDPAHPTSSIEHPASGVMRGSPDPAHVGLLGDFRILREIGRGGMGVVYEAEQISLGRRVALKVLPFAAMLDKQQLARFKNEARAAATLDHPNIVAIYSVGVERSVHYYAMQLIEGQSLAQVVEQLRKTLPLPPGEGRGEGALESEIRNPQSEIETEHAALPTLHAPTSSLPAFASRDYFRTVAQLGIQAAEALDHAHQNGILHRDIKPANLLVECSGAGGASSIQHLKLWITDFGLARMEQDAGMTMSGDILGTLRYMSPEQALAKRVVVDHRSDIYSLGVTLYELLTLQPAFHGDDRQELLRQIAFEEPRKLRQVSPRVPHDLETIVLKAIEKNPADRYASAHELAADFRRFSQDRAIHARRPNFRQHLARFARRHRAATTFMLVAAIFVAIVSTAAIADRRRQIRETRLSVEISLREARKAIEDNDINQAATRLAEAQIRIDVGRLGKASLVEDVRTLLFEVDRFRQFQTLSDESRLHATGDEAGITPADTALALYKVVERPDWLRELERLNLPEDHVQRITDTAYDLLLLKADHLTRWSAGWPKATRQVRLEVQSREAIGLLERAVAFHAPSRGYYWLLANCWLHLGDQVREKQLRATALATAPRSANELFYINRDRIWGTVAHNADYPAYSFEDSYRDHREMVRLDPTYYNALYFMATRLHNERRYAEALVGWYACTMIRPDHLAALGFRAQAHSQLGHFDEAKADIDTALAKTKSPRTPGYVAFFLATCPRSEMRDGARAIQLAEKSCRLTHYTDPELVDALACAYAEVGNFEAAKKWSEMAVQLADDLQREGYEKHLTAFRQGKPWREE
jgi:serine/threonine protein kinase